jgi:hypothetical protein
MASKSRKNKDEEEIKRRTALLTVALDVFTVANRYPEQAQLAKEVEELEREILDSEKRSASKRSEWRVIARIGGAAAAVGSAASGGALTANFTGSGAVALGVSALVLALFGAIAVGLEAEAEYERDRAKSRAYEQLWWEILLFATVNLPTVPATHAQATLTEFTRRRRDIG